MQCSRTCVKEGAAFRICSDQWTVLHATAMDTDHGAV